MLHAGRRREAEKRSRTRLQTTQQLWSERPTPPQLHPAVRRPLYRPLPGKPRYMLALASFGFAPPAADKVTVLFLTEAG